MNEYRTTRRIHDLISAVGWWAVFEIDAGYSVEPVVLWAVVDEGEPGHEDVQGLVQADGDGLLSAEEAVNFVAYELAESADGAASAVAARRAARATARSRPSGADSGPHSRPQSGAGPRVS